MEARPDHLRTFVTLTLNPTVDIASDADRVRPVHKVRTKNETFDPGGGGVNVSRVLRELGDFRLRTNKRYQRARI